MYRQFLRGALVVALLMTLVPFSIAGAATGSDITMTVGCDGFSVSGGSINFEDATSAVLRAVDASGTVLYQQVITRPTNGTYTFDTDASFSWTTEPEFSPIILSIETQTENIVTNELVFLVVGGCGSLPARANAFAILADYDLLALVSDLDGSTAASVPLNAAPPRPVNDDTLIDRLPGYAVVNTDNLNVRSGPGVQYTQVAVVDGGTELIVLGRSEAGLADASGDLWWYVEVGGLRGWVNSALLVLRGDLTFVPVVPAQGELIPPSVYVGFNGTLLYSEPSTASAVLCPIVGDTFYTAVARDSSPANHYLIQAECLDGTAAEGWLPLESLIFRNDGGVRLPIAGA